MKRRDLFKMFATLAAMPLVAPLAALCKPKRVRDAAYIECAKPLFSLPLDKFTNWPEYKQRKLIEMFHAMPPVNDLLSEHHTQTAFTMKPQGIDTTRTFYGRGRHGMPETWEWSNTPFEGEKS